MPKACEIILKACFSRLLKSLLNYFADSAACSGGTIHKRESTRPVGFVEARALQVENEGTQTDVHVCQCCFQKSAVFGSKQ